MPFSSILGSVLIDIYRIVTSDKSWRSTGTLHTASGEQLGRILTTTGPCTISSKFWFVFCKMDFYANYNRFNAVLTTSEIDAEDCW